MIEERSRAKTDENAFLINITYKISLSKFFRFPHHRNILYYFISYINVSDTNTSHISTQFHSSSSFPLVFPRDSCLFMVVNVLTGGKKC